jgi:hypothetical protein
MRAQVSSGSETEDWYWQLPDTQELETISFRLVDAAGKKGVPPQRRVLVDPVDAKKTKKLAARAWAAAKKEMSSKKRASKPNKPLKTRRAQKSARAS